MHTFSEACPVMGNKGRICPLLERFYAPPLNIPWSNSKEYVSASHEKSSHVGHRGNTPKLVFFCYNKIFYTLLSVMPKGAETNLGKVRLPQMKIFIPRNP